MELATQAKAKGIDIIAITDHDIIKKSGEELILLGIAGKVYYTKHLTNGEKYYLSLAKSTTY